MYLTPGHFTVLGPGVPITALPPPADTRAPSASRTAPFARRVSRTTGARTSDSLAAITLNAAPTDPLPSTPPPARVLAWGVQFDQPFRDGRWVAIGTTGTGFDVLAEGTAGGARYRRFRVDAVAQGLDGSPKLFEPIRAQSLTAELVRAVACLGSAALDPVEPATSPVPLLTDADHHRLHTEGRWPSRVLGFVTMMVGALIMLAGTTVSSSTDLGRRLKAG